jgi:hypothetical protein
MELKTANLYLKIQRQHQLIPSDDTKKIRLKNKVPKPEKVTASTEQNQGKQEERKE